MLKVDALLKFEAVSSWLKDEVAKRLVCKKHTLVEDILNMSLSAAQVVPRKKDGWQTSFCMCVPGSEREHGNCRTLHHRPAAAHLAHKVIEYFSP